MNNTYPYPYSAAEARERNELSLWRESHRANIACRHGFLRSSLNCMATVAMEMMVQFWAVSLD